MKKLFMFLAVFAIATGFVPTSQAEAVKNQFVTIGTGDVTGVYYPTGSAISCLVNKTKKNHGICCLVESTGGSIYNLNAIRSGELDMGVVQSGWQYHAYHGTGNFRNQGANKNLRAVFSTYPEPFTVIARADSGIKNFQNLKGKRVNVGNPGSGQYGTLDVVMDVLGWAMDDLKFVSELNPSEQSKALCDNKIDAMIFITGHPSGFIKATSTSCDSALVNVTGPEIDKLVADNDYYRYATIPGGMYQGTPDDTHTFGVGATFVSSATVPEDVIYNVVKAVFDNIDDFKKFHPAFANLKPSKMIKDGLSAPLHKGAVKYYKEVGLM
jgi:TRAP transporter TAXI family solute receptor